MKYRNLGKSGLKVSEISLGSRITLGGNAEREKTIQTIRAAYELGINFFDTANVYEKGEAEKIVGQALREYPRESYVLATKVFFEMGDGPNDRGLSRKHIKEQCEASLKRLGLDYVDIYYCHRYDPNTPLEETLRALDDLVAQGKVLYVGVSGWTASQIIMAHAIADRYLLDRMIVNQPVYHMFDRHIEQEIIPQCEQIGVGQVTYSPLAQGLLTGKYSSLHHFPKDSGAAKLDRVRKGITEERISQVQQLAQMAQHLGITVGQLAVAWVLRHKNVASALVGASNPGQIRENAKTSDIALSQDVLEQIEQIISK